MSKVTALLRCKRDSLFLLPVVTIPASILLLLLFLPTALFCGSIIVVVDVGVGCRVTQKTFPFRFRFVSSCLVVLEMR